ncbi:hypothetical protein H1R20_g6267, partial [Candolleomyces eurysporus]
MEFPQQTPRFQVPESVVVDAEEDDDEEVEEWLLEQELAREGLYRGAFFVIVVGAELEAYDSTSIGSYNHLIAWYTLTPISTILTFALLAIFPVVIYPLDPKFPQSPYPYAPYLPFPLPELLTAAGMWSMSLLLREFVYSLPSSLSLTLPPYASLLLSLLATAFQTLISVSLQLAAVVLLLITPTPGINHPTWHDHAFRRVWTIALGWAGAEAIVGIKQGYENIALYRDVLVNVKKISEEDSLIPGEGTVSSSVSPALTRSSTRSQELSPYHDEDGPVRGERQPLLAKPPQANGLYRFSKNALEQEVQNDLDQLIALRSREELEEIYGIPVIHVPVFISCLHRINAVLNSLGTFLVLSAAYLRSPLAPSIPDRPPIPSFSSENYSSLLQISRTLAGLTVHRDSILGLTAVAVVICQMGLSLLHTAWVLPKIGVPTHVYVGLLVSLVLFFAGLALWEVLV